MGSAFDQALTARNDLRLGAALTAGVGAAAALGGAFSLATEGFGPPLSVGAATSAGELRYHLSLVSVGLSGAF